MNILRALTYIVTGVCSFAIGITIEMNIITFVLLMGIIFGNLYIGVCLGRGE